MLLSIKSDPSAQRQQNSKLDFQGSKHTTSTEDLRMRNASGVVIVRVPQVLAKTGMSRSKLYSLINKNSRYYDESFPKKAVIGTGPHSRAVGWRLHEIDHWLDAQFDKQQGRLL